jgi:hypothetical protein
MEVQIMKKFRIGVLVLITALTLFFLTQELCALPLYQINDVSGSTLGFNEGPIYNITGFNEGPIYNITPISGGPSFDTFCLENNELIHLGGQYYGTFDSEAQVLNLWFTDLDPPFRYGAQIQFSVPVSVPVPEPSTLLLLGLGLVGFGIFGRKRFRRKD